MDSALLVAQVRTICLAFPGATERTSHGTPTFFVGRQFVQIWPDGHHEMTFPHLWCAAPPGAQAARIADDPRRFFRPPYVGVRGWLGVRLDRPMPKAELAGLCEDAYCTVAPKSRLAELGRARGDDRSRGALPRE